MIKMMRKLTIKTLIKEAELFCIEQSRFQHKELFGVTDGKAVGTLIEQKFQKQLHEYGSSQNLVRRSEIRILRPTVGRLGCLWLGIVLVPVALEAFKAPRQGLTKLKAVV